MIFLNNICGFQESEQMDKEVYPELGTAQAD